MADLNLSASPSPGGEKPKTPAPKGPAAGTPKLRMSPAGDHSPVSRTAGAIIGVVSVVALALAIFLSNPSAPTTQGTGGLRNHGLVGNADRAHNPRVRGRRWHGVHAQPHRGAGRRSPHR